MFLQRLAECEQHQAKETLLQTAPQMLELLTLEHDPGLPKNWMTGGTREQCCKMNCLPVLCTKQTALVREIHTELSPLAAAVRQGGKSCSVPVPCKSAQRHGTFGQRGQPGKKRQKILDKSMQSLKARTEAFEAALQPRVEQLRGLRVTRTTRRGAKKSAPPCWDCITTICAAGKKKLGGRTDKNNNSSMVAKLGLGTKRQHNRSGARFKKKNISPIV